MPIRTGKQEELLKRMHDLQIFEKDLIEKFITGSGKGGQKMNKTASCVYIKHLPSSIEVKCQKDRSREINRFLARRELCDRFESKILKIKTAKQKEIDKLRRQKKRRSRRQKEKILEVKRQHSEKKEFRKKITP